MADEPQEEFWVQYQSPREEVIIKPFRIHFVFLVGGKLPDGQVLF